MILTLASWIARPAGVHESGKTVHIYYETLDTGESRQKFGQTAKHLILRERVVAEPGACDQSRQRDTDGWFLPAENPQTKPELHTFAAIRNQTCRDQIVRHGKPPELGIAIYEKDGQITREMLEFSRDNLDDSLFNVPRDFKKVDTLAGERSASWHERLGMEFSELGRAFETWF